MKVTRDIGLLFRRYMTQMLRTPVWLFVGFSTPILYLVLFTPLLRNVSKGPGPHQENVLNALLPGILRAPGVLRWIGLGFTTIFELRAGVAERLG